MVIAQKWMLFLLAVCLLMPCEAMCAAEEDVESEKSSVRNVGGLLFDYDEGVEIEQGPGGSVYVKSNREYMKLKFEEIDSRFEEYEVRITQLEERAGIKPMNEEEPVQKSDKASERRVLAT